MKKFRVDWYDNLGEKRKYFYTNSIKSALKCYGEKLREKKEYVRLLHNVGASFVPEILRSYTDATCKIFLTREGLTKDDAIRIIKGEEWD
jgi:hypothetical protein